ncbi:MAG: InlB B-repeat-containing protein [Clostridia bacterium]|nr:InlB B-repeat-containing protein [Clostridia bacterium]
MKKLLLSTLLVATLLLIIGCTAVDFDISFVSDGQVVHTVSTSGSEAITLPNNPVKEGFVFEGWYWDKDTWQKPFTASSLLNEPLTANMSVYAKWTPEVVPPQNYTVTFNSMGGSLVNDQVLLFGDFISKPVDPIKTNYAFGGWYLDKDYTVTWDFAVGVVTEDSTLYAKWIDKYLVTLNVNGGTLANDTESEFYIVDGEKISQLPTPTRELYTFGGWYKDEACTTPWDLGIDAVDENTILFAKWIKHHLVTLNANGGTLANDTEGEFYIVDGEKISQLPAPTRELYTFGGWYKDEACTTPWDLSTDAVTTDTILYAKWTKLHFITLDPNGGTLADDVETEFYRGEEEKIGKLPTPTRKGYTFLGWYFVDDIALEEKITRSFEVEYDMDLIAQWQRNEGEGTLVTVELMLGADESFVTDEEGNVPNDVIELEAGDRLGRLPIAEKNGFRFKGWYDENGALYTQTSIIKVNLRLFPKFDKIYYCIDGTENHDWASTGGYKLKSEATCTTAEIHERKCGRPGCGVVESTEMNPALGHEYDWNDEIPMQRTGICSRCGDDEKIEFVDVTLEAMGKGNPKVESSAGWGLALGADLIDGDWESKTICGNQKPISVTLEFEKATMVDVIYVAGQGTAGYTITWYDADGEEVGYDRGAFGSIAAGNYIVMFEVGAEIAKVVIEQPTPSYGQDYWSEIRLAQYPEE